MADVSKIKLPDGNTYNIKDDTSGYITGYTETDPVFTASAAHGITASDIAKWNNSGAFFAEFEVTTSAEIEAAYQAGKAIYAVYEPISGTTLVGGLLTRSSSTSHLFSIAINNGFIFLICSADVWDMSSTNFQDELVSGTNIKTINNQSLLGSGNLTIENESDIFVAEYNPQTETGTPFNDIKAAYEAGKHVILDVSAQDSAHTFLPLVLFLDRSTSETQNATVGFSIVQNGNNNGALVSAVCTVHPDPEDSSQSIEEWEIFDFDVQPELSSGTNIKTINNQSLLGSGNLALNIPEVYNSSTNPNGYLTMSTLPIYDGTVV